jgi:type IV pilus assembly protein PilM
MLGIDLRVSAVKVVEVEKPEQGGFVLKSWGMTEVPSLLLDKHPQLEDAKGDALRKILQTNKMTSREGVAVVGGSEVLVKLFTLADLPYDEIAQVIRAKFAEEAPYPITDALVDFYPLPKGVTVTDKTDFVAACVSRKVFLETQHVLGRAGVKLVGITVLPDALQEAFHSELSPEKAKIVSVIYMGRRTTNINIFRNGYFEFNREVPMGGENITLAMSGILVAPEGKVEVSIEEAEKIKTEQGIPINLENYPALGNIPLTQLQAMVRPALEKIQNEISRTFEYYKGQTGEASVNKIIMTGGSSLTPNLKEFIAEGLGIPITAPEVLPKFNPRLTPALGAALTEGRRLNLVPEEIKHYWKLMRQRFMQIQILLPVFLALLGLVYALFFLQAFRLQMELSYIKNKLEEYNPRLTRLEAFEKISKEEERRRQVIKTFEAKTTKLPSVLEELSRYTPRSAFLTNLKMTTDGIHIWGVVLEDNDTPENILSRFVMAISLSSVFTDVQLVQAAKNFDYTEDAFNFEILAKLKE